MLSTILLMFTQIINSFREITFNIGGINISLFTLLVGIFIFATLCRTYMKYVLDLPLNVQATTNDIFNKFMEQQRKSRKVFKVVTKYYND